MKFTLSIAISKRQILCWPNIDSGGRKRCRDGFILVQNTFSRSRGDKGLKKGWFLCSRTFSLFTKIIPGLSSEEKCDFRLIAKIFMKVFECSMHKRIAAPQIKRNYRYGRKLYPFFHCNQTTWLDIMTKSPFYFRVTNKKMSDEIQS